MHIERGDQFHRTAFYAMFKFHHSEEEDHMAFLTATDDDTPETAEEEDHMDFLTATGEDTSQG